MKTTEKSQNNITTDEILARRTESKTTNRVVKPEKDDQNDKLSSVSGKLKFFLFFFLSFFFSFFFLSFFFYFIYM